LWKGTEDTNDLVCWFNDIAALSGITNVGRQHTLIEELKNIGTVITNESDINENKVQQ